MLLIEGLFDLLAQPLAEAIALVSGSAARPGTGYEGIEAGFVPLT